MDFPRLHW